MLPTIDSLSKGTGFNVKNVIKNCSELRHIHGWHNQGFTTKRTMKRIAEIPLEFKIRHLSCMNCNGNGFRNGDVKSVFPCLKCRGTGKADNPFYRRYFDDRMDKHEKKKNMLKFLRDNPQYKT